MKQPNRQIFQNVVSQKYRFFNINEQESSLHVNEYTFFLFFFVRHEPPQIKAKGIITIIWPQWSCRSVSLMYTDLLINPIWKAVPVFSTFYIPRRHGQCTYLPYSKTFKLGAILR